MVSELPRQWLRIRFLTTSFCIRYKAIWIDQNLQVEALLLVELLPGIHSYDGSEVPQAFKDTSTTNIITISGIKLSEMDLLLGILNTSSLDSHPLCQG